MKLSEKLKKHLNKIEHLFSIESSNIIKMCLDGKISLLKKYLPKIKQLENKIENMKCCGNCINAYDLEFFNQYSHVCDYYNDCINYSKWESKK